MPRLPGQVDIAWRLLQTLDLEVARRFGVRAKICHQAHAVAAESMELLDVDHHCDLFPVPSHNLWLAPFGRPDELAELLLRVLELPAHRSNLQ
jgi:hypothetical protein